MSRGCAPALCRCSPGLPSAGLCPGHGPIWHTHHPHLPQNPFPTLFFLLDSLSKPQQCQKTALPQLPPYQALLKKNTPPKALTPTTTTSVIATCHGWAVWCWDTEDQPWGCWGDAGLMGKPGKPQPFLSLQPATNCDAGALTQIHVCLPSNVMCQGYGGKKSHKQLPKIQPPPTASSWATQLPYNGERETLKLRVL